VSFNFAQLAKGLGLPVDGVHVEMISKEYVLSTEVVRLVLRGIIAASGGR
jgi:hypothetical protein